MIYLPHNCSCSELKVNPKNWKTTIKKSDLKKKWYIQYYFRDPVFSKKYPYGKEVKVRGMNKYKSLEDRRQATKDLIENEIYMLKIEGFNPITGEFKGMENFTDNEVIIDSETLICEAVETAFNNLEGEKSTLSGVKTAKKYFVMSTVALKLDILKIKDVKKLHIKRILNHQAKVNKYSNDRFNKIRAYMMMIFNEILDCEAIEYNPINKIAIKKTTKKIITVMTDDEIKKVKEYLKPNFYSFYRYMEIFFHSGCRSTELMNVRACDVNIKDQTFKVLIKKGKNHREELRAININVLDFWIELVTKANNEDYLFSNDLEPGINPISERQITIRWRRHVKNKLGINVDFYKLKHLHTTKTIDAYSKKIAAAVNGHTSNKMNEKHYDALHKKRMLNTAKNLNIKL
ncbi:site-specific integrase [Kordia sp.]|uniref:tyrosine-type recombinase/integrase n=1 Tax=Kordia sp. TaxID=1965332 RepID=UPI0025B8F953|nr:site-specific integrase [Kordia sp.]